MLILRSGIDIIEIDRFEALQPGLRQRFIERIFTPAEIELVSETNPNPTLAGHFAAKEAVAKALGTGIGVISWHEIEIYHGNNGEPLLHLSGKAARLAQELGLTQWAISISHSRLVAVASATAIGETSIPE